MTLPARLPAIRDLMRRLLDRGFTQAAQAVLQALPVAVRPGGILALDFQQLDAEIMRLVRLDQKLTVTNPVLRNLINDMRTELRRQAALIDATATQVQVNGIQAAQTIARQMAFPGVDPRVLARVGIQWNVPDPDAIAQVVQWMNKAGWQDLLNTYSSGIMQSMNNIILRGIVNGYNPRRTALELRTMFPSLTSFEAENILRTVQLQSYRYANAANYAANRNILEPYGIRVAALGSRTCAACVALHGTQVPIDEPLDEHWSGRCTVVPVIRGQSVEIESGADWFGQQDEATQRGILGNAAYAAYQAGAVDLQDFVGQTSDPVFGPMLRTESLKGVMGTSAQQYYGVS